ncbi:MAG TPA: M1 family aminopeptidase [Verrucomicrobiae bacterium]|nr:M1 family aminopeptidase [Verrucomicrobiae bacterium]
MTPSATQSVTQPAQLVAAPGEAMALYRQLLNPVFDVRDVHRVRQVQIDREDLHVVLTDGVIGLIRPVNGRVTGAFFEGEGHILVFPPDRAERTSLALFTGSGVLDQKFGVAYLRFFDDKLVQELQAEFRPEEDAQEFIDKWERSETLLARADSLALLRAMTASQPAGSGYIHLRLAGTPVGTFDVVLDTHSAEQIGVSQAVSSSAGIFYDAWLSFPMRSAREGRKKGPQAGLEFEASDYKLKTKLSPPRELSAEAQVTIKPQMPGERTVIFELSRYLKVTDVRVNGRPAEFIQNEAIDGSDLARRGNDLMAVVLAAPAEKEVPLKLEFRYSGPVMFDAGGEVIYVGARGTWYPSPSYSLASYDLTFQYPAGWTLAATGEQVSSVTDHGVQTTRFVTGKPIGRAGFNLGKFETAEATAGSVAVRAYAARHVEESLAAQEARAGLHPDPAKEVQRIADQAASTVRFLSGELDAFPYSRLEISQLPALISQSWPGLIYLSSMAYLDPRERQALGVHDAFMELLLGKLMLAHESAHQWWGDAVNGESYRDEWMVEALANYSAMLLLEQEDTESTRVALDRYRDELLKTTPNGIVANAGPVTLGRRLTSSKFPNAVDPVLYGRGTWLIHMLRTMLRQAGDGKSDTRFFAALKGLLAGSTNHKISTLDLQRAFEQVMPPSLNYEGQNSLDWFFDSWVNGASIPELTLQNVRIVPAGSAVKISGAIRERYADKNLVTAVPVYAVGEDGVSRFLAFVFVDEDPTEFSMTGPAGTKTLLLDPQQTLLRR